MGTRRTKEQIDIAKRKKLIQEEFERNQIEETQSSKSFAEIDKHFTEAVSRLGKHASGLKASFFIRKGADAKLGDMAFIRVAGKYGAFSSMTLCNHILKSDDPANKIVCHLWECIGLAKGVCKSQWT
jgi:hypothetical protein